MTRLAFRDGLWHFMSPGSWRKCLCGKIIKTGDHWVKVDIANPYAQGFILCKKCQSLKNKKVEK